jgi:hypothetical protein
MNRSLAATIMRQPSGDRGPSLRALAQHHRAALSGLDMQDPDRPTRMRHARHARALARIERMARMVRAGSLSERSI